MAFKDNREFIDALKKTNDVVCIKKEVDWELEAGAVTRRSYELSGPAPLFEKVKDYPEGYRIFGGPLGTYRRIAVAMGLPADTPIKGIYDEYERRQDRLIPPVVVKDGPCKENIMLGDEVDLYRFPAPICHEGDGGRYIGTWCFSVTKDPESEWVNWGMYRYMIADQRALTGNPTPVSHLATIFREKYLPKNLPMPTALVIGADPLSSLVSLGGFAAGQSEADYAGALHQQPVEVIKCETNDLLVPAHAEIVIEGEILPDVVDYEGPFGEYTGYRIGERTKKPLFRVNAVTYRNSPIVPMCVHGIPSDEGQVAAAMGTAIGLRRMFRKRGLPVKDVYLPPEGASHLAIVSVEQGGNEVARAVKEAMTARRAWYNKIIVVDDDVDIYNLGEVIHALSVKCHPFRGISASEEPGKGAPMTPCYSKEERAKLYAAVALLDATWPKEWAEEDIPAKSSFKSVYPQELQDKVINSWKEYGF